MKQKHSYFSYYALQTSGKKQYAFTANVMN